MWTIRSPASCARSANLGFRDSLFYGSFEALVAKDFDLAVVLTDLANSHWWYYWWPSRCALLYKTDSSKKL